MLGIFQGRKSSTADEFLVAEMTGSGIRPETATACGVHVESDHRIIAQYLGWKSAKRLGDVLVYPHFNMDGASSGKIFQVKPANQIDGRGKYETPKGQGNLLFIPPLPVVTEAIHDTKQHLVITEGVKKAIAGSQDGIPTLALSGVDNWSKRRDKDDQGRGVGERELIDDLLAIDWTNRPTGIAFDTDARSNPNVNRAACQLAEALTRHGAKVEILHFPHEFDAELKVFRKFGIDDWIVAKGAGSFKTFVKQSIKKRVPKTLTRYRNEMRRNRESIRNRPGVYLFREPTGAGKSHADIEEIPHYRRTLTVTPTHTNGREVLRKYRENGIDAAIMPELSICERKTCRREDCERFKYGPDACVKNACQNYDEASRALSWGLSPASTVCLRCEFKDDCIYRRRLEAATASKHVICTNSRLSNSLGAVTKEVKFITIHEAALNTLRPTIEIQGRPETISFLETIVEASRKLNQSFLDNKEKRLFAWRLADAAQTFLDVFQTDPNKLESGALNLSGDASISPGVPGDLFDNLDAMGLPSGNGNVMKLCVHAATGNLASCGVKVVPCKFQNADGETVETKLVSVIGVVRVELNQSATVLLNDASASPETLRSATGLDIIDLTPDGGIENQGWIVQMPLDITQRTKQEKVLGMLRSVLLQYPEKNQIGLITHKKHLEFIEENLTEQEKSRIVKTDHFRGTSSRGSNNWMRCDLLIIAGTPRVPPSVVETELVKAGHPEAISRGGEKNWGPDFWLGRREDGRAAMVQTLGYRDYHWAAACQSIVREELKQCIGRARAICSDGV